MLRIPVNEIGYEPKYYPRVNGREDWYTVNIYKSALLANPSLAFGWRRGVPSAGFPPVVLVRVRGRDWPYLLLDGLHRLRTYYAADYKEIPATIETLPESKWLARSVELNIAGKRGLDAGDKAFVAQQLGSDGWPDDRVARLLQMDVGTLEKIKASRIVKISGAVATKITAGRSNREINGKNYGFLKGPLTEFAGTATAQKALAVQEPIASRSAARVLDSAIAVLECGVDMTDEEIAAKVNRLRKLLP